VNVSKIEENKTVKMASYRKTSTGPSDLKIIVSNTVHYSILQKAALRFPKSVPNFRQF
jgi:hypothetical protein